MKRSVMNVARLRNVLAVAALSLACAAGCGVVEGDEWVVPSVQEISTQQSEVYRLCREMEPILRGTEVSAFEVIDYDRLVALKFGGRVQCLDDVDAVRRVGIIPIEDTSDQPGCKFCGTPLPADKLVEGPEDDDKGK